MIRAASVIIMLAAVTFALITMTSGTAGQQVAGPWGMSIVFSLIALDCSAVIARRRRR